MFWLTVAARWLLSLPGSVVCGVQARRWLGARRDHVPVDDAGRRAVAPWL